jgi:hypothetical protein
LVFAKARSKRTKKRRGSPPCSHLLKVISLDCNHETKATLLSYLRAIKHTPKNASILFLSSTIIKSKHHQTCLSCPSIHPPLLSQPSTPATQIFMHMHLLRHPMPVRLLGGPTNHILHSYARELTVDETAALERLKSNHN